MHIPDGFIDTPTSIVGGVAALGLVTVSVRQAAKQLDDKIAPLAGLTAAFIFAVQMLNFPVAAGTSGHLMGGALAAILVGPWIGSLSMTVVFVVQALVFADGGLSALGLNVILMGYCTCFIAYGVFVLLQRVLPANRPMLVASSMVSAWAGVLAASVLFVGYYAVGGTGEVDLATVAAAMIGVHVLIGIGEAVITGLTISAVSAGRPDLVYGARHLVPASTIASVPDATIGSAAGPRR